jgi:hypothetical protein
VCGDRNCRSILNPFVAFASSIICDCMFLESPDTTEFQVRRAVNDVPGTCTCRENAAAVLKL